MAVVPVWPLTLQQYVNEQSFSYAFGDTLLRSDMDIGPAKVRRRSTRPVDTMNCGINLPIADYITFSQFYKTAVNGGATAFQFKHPITQETLLVRFIKPPEISPLGGVVFQVGMSFEILPQ